MQKTPNAQQAVWRKRGCCLVGHFAGFWKFTSRPSLTDTPACPKLPVVRNRRQCVTADNEVANLTLNKLKK